MSLLQSICDRFPKVNFLLFIERIWCACMLLSYPCCYGFQVLGDIFRIVYFVSTMVLNLHLYSQQIETVELILPHV